MMETGFAPTGLLPIPSSLPFPGVSSRNEFNRLIEVDAEPRTHHKAAIVPWTIGKSDARRNISPICRIDRRYACACKTNPPLLGRNVERSV